MVAQGQLLTCYVGLQKESDVLHAIVRILKLTFSNLSASAYRLFMFKLRLNIACCAYSHKNAAVRKATSQFLVAVVEKMGPGRVLSGIKDVTDRILPTAVNFLTDGQQETR